MSNKLLLLLCSGMNKNNMSVNVFMMVDNGWLIDYGKQWIV